MLLTLIHFYKRGLKWKKSLQTDLERERECWNHERFLANFWALSRLVANFKAKAEYSKRRIGFKDPEQDKDALLFWLKMLKWSREQTKTKTFLSLLKSILKLMHLDSFCCSTRSKKKLFCFQMGEKSRTLQSWSEEKKEKGELGRSIIGYQLQSEECIYRLCCSSSIEDSKTKLLFFLLLSFFLS